MAIGLVAITRGLGASLSALSSLQRRDTYLSIAESTFQTLRAEAQDAPPLPSHRRHGSCGEAAVECEWELAHEPFSPPELDLPADAMRLVTLTVRSTQGRRGIVRLQALWPSDWLTE